MVIDAWAVANIVCLKCLRYHSSLSTKLVCPAAASYPVTGNFKFGNGQYNRSIVARAYRWPVRVSGARPLLSLWMRKFRHCSVRGPWKRWEGSRISPAIVYTLRDWGAESPECLKVLCFGCGLL